MPRKGRKARVEARRPRAVAVEPRVDVDRSGIRLASLVASFALAVYGITLGSGLSGGDSGELAAAAYLGGVAHPPGYPLYLLLAGLLSHLLPFGPVAWRVALFSALCDAGAAFFLCLAVARWSRSLWAGALAALLFAFCPLVWRYAITAEVFPLNNLLVAGMLYLGTRFADAPDAAARRRTVTAAAVILGLGLTNHQTFVFFGLPLFAWMLWSARRELATGRELGRLLLFVALGLLPDLYLPIAARTPRMVSWGDQTTLGGLLTHLLRREYGTLRLGTSEQFTVSGALGEHLLFFFRESLAQLLYGGALLAAYGGWVSMRRTTGDESRAELSRVLLLSLGAYLLVFCGLSNVRLDDGVSRAVEARFWQQALIPLFAWSAIAASRLLRERTLMAVAVLAGLLQLTLHFGQENRRGMHLYEAFGRGILEPLPPGAILLSRGDHYTGTLRYLQECEGVRGDVSVLDRNYLSYPWHARAVRARYPDVVLPGAGFYHPNGFNLRDFLDANLPRHPVFLVDLEEMSSDTSIEGHYRLWPEGFVFEFLPQDTPLPLDEWKDRHELMLSKFDPRVFAGRTLDGWDALVEQNYWDTQFQFATFLIRDAVATGNDRRKLDLAASVLERLAHDVSPPNPIIERELGGAYYLISQTDPSAVPRMMQAWTRFLASSPREDQQTAMIRKIVAGTPR